MFFIKKFFIKTLKLKTKLEAKHSQKPKKVIHVNVNFSTLHHKQQYKKQLKHVAESEKSKVKRQKMMNVFWDAFWQEKCV